MVNKNNGLATRLHGKYKSLRQCCRNGASIYEHIIVVERVNGRPLRKGEVVHHKNGNRLDNRPANLVLCENQKAHFRLHRLKDFYYLKGRKPRGK